MLDVKKWSSFGFNFNLSMPTPSSTHIASQFNRRTRNTCGSVAVEKQSGRSLETSYNPNNMRPKEEPNTIPNGTVKKEKAVRYRECRKNHAANIGGYAVDGCREFMASGEEGTSAALKCAACSCHRNFHKREVENEALCDCSSNSTSQK